MDYSSSTSYTLYNSSSYSILRQYVSRHHRSIDRLEGIPVEESLDTPTVVADIPAALGTTAVVDTTAAVDTADKAGVTTAHIALLYRLHILVKNGTLEPKVSSVSMNSILV